MTFTLKPLKLPLLRLFRSAPCQSLYNIASALRASQPAEERAPHYDPKHFYPMQIPTILAERYQVALKLGWGTISLAMDLHQYVSQPFV